MAMLEGIFDIKNDRRLSMYLNRMSFGMWLMYLALGAPALKAYAHYRIDCAVWTCILLVCSFSASMVYDYFHNHEYYETKKKFLVISYVLLAAVVYFFEFYQKGKVIDINWLLGLL